jgi:hypothetical protein
MYLSIMDRWAALHWTISLHAPAIFHAGSLGSCNEFTFSKPMRHQILRPI